MDLIVNITKNIIDVWYQNKNDCHFTTIHSFPICENIVLTYELTYTKN